MCHPGLDPGSHGLQLFGGFSKYREKKYGRQCISTNDDYKTQHYVLEELAAEKDSVC